MVEYASFCGSLITIGSVALFLSPCCTACQWDTGALGAERLTKRALLLTDTLASAVIKDMRKFANLSVRAPNEDALALGPMKGLVGETLWGVLAFTLAGLGIEDLEWGAQRFLADTGAGRLQKDPIGSAFWAVWAVTRARFGVEGGSGKLAHGAMETLALAPPLIEHLWASADMGLFARTSARILVQDLIGGAMHTVRALTSAANWVILLWGDTLGGRWALALAVVGVEDMSWDGAVFRHIRTFALACLGVESLCFVAGRLRVGADTAACVLVKDLCLHAFWPVRTLALTCLPVETLRFGTRQSVRADAATRGKVEYLC